MTHETNDTPSADLAAKPDSILGRLEAIEEYIRVDRQIALLIYGAHARRVEATQAEAHFHELIRRRLAGSESTEVTDMHLSDLALDMDFQELYNTMQRQLHSMMTRELVAEAVNHER